MNICLKKTYLYIIVFLVIAGCQGGPPKPSFTKYSEAGIVMGTVAKLDVCHKGFPAQGLKEAYSQAWLRLEEIHWRMSVFDDASDVWKVNRSFRNPTQIEEDTYRLLKTSIKISEQSYGAFDITVWPLMKLWKDNQERNRFPRRRSIKKAKQFVGVQHIKLLDRERVEMSNNKTQIDLGGIAKGYAIDEVARIFRSYGLENFMIDAGGDIYVGGVNCYRKPWRIGIKDPRDTSKIIDRIEVSNSAIATSGHYEQYFEIRGQKWSHIINPVTGYPQKGVVSATVIAPEATQADAWATALSVLNPQQGLEIIDSFGEDWGAMVMSQKKDRFLKEESLHYQKLKAKNSN